MPFKSQAQRGYMFAQHPEIAKRWAGEMKQSGQSMKKLPERVGPSNAPKKNPWMNMK